ncbi:hypothetical protein FDG2_2428 [Candidatus Protofrankia californiensis]|uniref:Beta-lactamase-related domain-containing protein n=1 Tax=Candidatus Protofrankia californiensis TaxID=1839754 RepID=A0A1C3NXL3_9ACTN|nr:hypothetical protein FDG2_2428 [Candidatus Protofrankia californiensis]
MGMTMLLSNDDELIALSGPIQGVVSRGLEGVVDAFAANLADGLEIGAAFAVSQEGRCVVDIWGGFADGEGERPWSPDTLCPVFSGTKGLVALCLAILIDEGRLELNRGVRDYWPEFGKPGVLVRDVVSHTSRLPGITQPISVHDFLNQARMAEVIAAEQPSDDPRAAQCYHPFTFGWICAELIQRIDGRPLGLFFQEEVATPLGLELWIGLPAHLEHRVAVLSLASSWTQSYFLQPRFYSGDPLQRAIWANPKVLTADSFIWNDPRTHAAGVPGGGAIGTARAMAKMYDCLPELISREVLDLASTPLSQGLFGPIGEHRRFGVGFQLANDDQSLGPADALIGHTGAGGSIHGRWLDKSVGFSYLMNQLRGDGDVQRADRLLRALHEAIM